MKKDQRNQALQVIRSADWFEGFSGELAENLVHHAYLAHFEPGEWAHGEGDEKRGLFIVIDGTFLTYCAVPGDRHVMVGQAEAGSVLGHATRFGGGPRLVTAVCATPATLLEVTEAALERIAEYRPELWRMIASSAYISLRRAVRATAEMIALPSRQRLARRLIACAKYSDNERPIVHLSQQMLAEMCGITRKTANLHLMDFQKCGYIELGYRCIMINQANGLSAVAES